MGEAVTVTASPTNGCLKPMYRFRAICPNHAFMATYNVTVFPLAVLKYEAGPVTTFARHLNAASAKTKRAVRRRSHRISYGAKRLYPTENVVGYDTARTRIVPHEDWVRHPNLVPRPSKVAERRAFRQNYLTPSGGARRMGDRYCEGQIKAPENMAPDLYHSIDHWSEQFAASLREVRDVKPR